MTERRLVYATLSIIAIGSLWCFAAQGSPSALGYLLGGIGSVGNLLLFTWLARTIAPGERQQKPWQAGLFIGRYIVMFGVGWTVVKALGVSPVPVLIGLLASSFAALALSLATLLGMLK